VLRLHHTHGCTRATRRVNNASVNRYVGRSHYKRHVWTCWRESPPIDLDGLYSDMECCSATRQVHAESEESPRDERRGERHLVSQ